MSTIQEKHSYIQEESSRIHPLPRKGQYCQLCEKRDAHQIGCKQELSVTTCLSCFSPPNKRSSPVGFIFWANSATLQFRRLWIHDYAWNFKETCSHLTNISLALTGLQIQRWAVPVLANTCSFWASCLEYSFRCNWIMSKTIYSTYPPS